MTVVHEVASRGSHARRNKCNAPLGKGSCRQSRPYDKELEMKTHDCDGALVTMLRTAKDWAVSLHGVLRLSSGPSPGGVPRAVRATRDGALAQASTNALYFRAGPTFNQRNSKLARSYLNNPFALSVGRPSFDFALATLTTNGRSRRLNIVF